MARSTKIYVVMTDEPCGTFTVRHECVTWLRQQPTANVLTMNVWTFDDGRATKLTSKTCAIHFIEGVR